ncbi:Hypothetical protein NTJ_03588 [Nesidiocoris tenuis]|uniref:Transmembrane protein n=1 Tax=Nesidiocoris tenuis TaxID=355587 RepID=A0ABN7AHV9_9HEMI|nr:Hypothetical protein NTJ_03588 [Nesidiocoris tenuis]
MPADSPLLRIDECAYYLSVNRYGHPPQSRGRRAMPGRLTISLFLRHYISYRLLFLSALPTCLFCLSLWTGLLHSTPVHGSQQRRVVTRKMGRHRQLDPRPADSFVRHAMKEPLSTFFLNPSHPHP